MFENLFKRFRAPAVMAEGMPYSQRPRLVPYEPGYAPSMQEDAAPPTEYRPLKQRAFPTSVPAREPDLAQYRRIIERQTATLTQYRLQIGALTRACVRYKRTIRGLRSPFRGAVTVNEVATAIADAPPVAERLVSRTVLPDGVERTRTMFQASDADTRTFLLMLREQGATLQVWHLKDNRDRALQIAKDTAVEHWEEHGYLVGNREDFQPHPWVVDAIQYALSLASSAEGQWDDIDPNSSLLCPIHLYRVKP